MVEPGFERRTGERISVQQALQERHVTEVAEHRAISGQDELLRIDVAEISRRHLGLEIAHRMQKQRTESRAEIDAEVGAALEGLTPHDPDELGVLHRSEEHTSELQS